MSEPISDFKRAVAHVRHSLFSPTSAFTHPSTESVGVPQKTEPPPPQLPPPHRDSMLDDIAELLLDAIEYIEGNRPDAALQAIWDAQSLLDGAR